ncbi:hypothetical protein FISHEDRAFT_69123 [Fistulina hepatica ATCC 64428]|uniref:Uncharacterized protein n=1 Tax=Fistulina hepatica ATCC 64428 TaxID=1128425 RepID=A0A0D7APN7_9AGAR|nr:hypothetical protein FISHEDRAFT_69123 [Fistulina hepatica ATCC 64428]
MALAQTLVSTPSFIESRPFADVPMAGGLGAGRLLVRATPDARFRAQPRVMSTFTFPAAPSPKGRTSRISDRGNVPSSKRSLSPAATTPLRPKKLRRHDSIADLESITYQFNASCPSPSLSTPSFSLSNCPIYNIKAVASSVNKEKSVLPGAATAAVNSCKGKDVARRMISHQRTRALAVVNTHCAPSSVPGNAPQIAAHPRIRSSSPLADEPVKPVLPRQVFPRSGPKPCFYKVALMNCQKRALQSIESSMPSTAMDVDGDDYRRSVADPRPWDRDVEMIDGTVIM